MKIFPLILDARTQLLCFLFMLISLFQFNVSAQEKVTSSVDQVESKTWNFVAAPYLLFASMNGDIIIRDVPIEVDASAGDIFENLDFALMLYFEAYNDNWVLIFDGIYMNLGQDGETIFTGRKTKVDLKQLALDFKGMYRVTNWFDAGVGFRINSLNAMASIAAGEILPGRKIEQVETWFDPLLVARAKTDFNGSSWKMKLAGDLGGFGIGSDFTWQLKPSLGYQFSKLFSMDLSYRWISIDYNTGNGDDYFKYDMVTSGPEIGFLFSF